MHVPLLRPFVLPGSVCSRADVLPLSPHTACAAAGDHAALFAAQAIHAVPAPTHAEEEARPLAVLLALPGAPAPLHAVCAPPYLPLAL
eukprot:scaffold105150_cov16-Tisochrysis_lutea.AAC.1